MVGVSAWCISVVLGTVSASVHRQESATVRVSGEIRGASGRHSIRVALWSEQGFLQKPVREMQIESGRGTRYVFVVSPGRWAVSAFEDRNENGALDMGLFGPKEPNGFWRAFHARRKPRFDDVAVTVEHDMVDADIELR